MLSFAFGQPLALRASPFHGKAGMGYSSRFSLLWKVGDRFFTPLLPPSSGRRWRVAPEVGFALFRLQPTPCPSGVPLPREGDRWATHPASPSFLGKEVARSAGGWLRSFSLSANPHPSGIPLPWEGGRFLTASPAFLRKEEICYLNSLQRSSKTSWLGFST